MTTTRHLLESITTLMDSLDHAERGLLTAAARTDLATRARVCLRRFEALVSTLVGEVERDGAAVVGRLTPTSTLLGLDGQTPRRQAAGEVFTGSTMVVLDEARGAALAGAITVGHVRAIGRVLADLPADLTDAQRDQAEHLLVCASTTTDTARVARLGDQVLAAVAPDRVTILSATERAAERERAAKARRSLVFAPDGHGSVDIRGSLPAVDASGLQTLVDAYAERDRRQGLDKLDRLAESRTVQQRRADGLMLLVRSAAAAGDAPTLNGDRPRVVVTVSHDTLRGLAAEVGVTGHAGEVGPGELRRICCDADILPVVLGGPSEVLDVGRAQRLVTPPIRAAVTIRDGGCVFPGCDKTPGECEAHHIRPWWNGGVTALQNLALVCRHHHGLVEPARFHPDGPPPDRWQLHLSDTDGLPEVIPPRRFDPDQTPRRHARFQISDAAMAVDETPAQDPVAAA